MPNYLVIAHFDGDHSPVTEVIRTLAQEPDSTFYLIVPATPPPNHDWTWSETEAYDAAKQRLNSLLGEFKQTGANITGDVVNYASLAAVEEVLQKAAYDGTQYDELVVATPPEDSARTPFADFEYHVRRISQIPIRHIVAPDAKPVERA